MSKETATTRGPRAARGEVKDRILTQARELFGANDYSKVTLRAIAERADCDPGLISYYFGSKIGVFRAAMALPDDPIDVILSAFEGGPGAGERVLNALMELLENSVAGEDLRQYVTSLLSDNQTMDNFTQWVDEELLVPMSQMLKGTNRRLRIQIAFGQVIGLIAVRYVYQIEPIASHPRNELARFIGPRLDVILGLAEATIVPSPRYAEQ